MGRLLYEPAHRRPEAPRVRAGKAFRRLRQNHPCQKSLAVYLQKTTLQTRPAIREAAVLFGTQLSNW